MRLQGQSPLRSSLFITVFCLIPLFFSGCYIIKQGQGQYKLRFNQVPLQQAIAEEEKEEVRELLDSIPQVKTFAIEQIGLKENDNYSGYFKTAEKGITYVITAASKTELKPYTWWFPIIGSVPYKGFFDLEDAKSLKKELEQSGYDTWLFAAPAYSTLGWFKDPVTTPMLRRGAFSLTETIIHEMTHATLYVDGKGDFNEQLASFVGSTATFQYYNGRQYMSEEQLQKQREKKETKRQYSRIVQSYIPKLDKLYKQQISQEKKLDLREEVFAQLIAEVRNNFPKISNKSLQFNNARVLQFKRYKEESPLFKKFWKESKMRWPQFWEEVHKYAEAL